MSDPKEGAIMRNKEPVMEDALHPTFAHPRFYLLSVKNEGTAWFLEVRVPETKRYVESAFLDLFGGFESLVHLLSGCQDRLVHHT